MKIRLGILGAAAAALAILPACSYFVATTGKEDVKKMDEKMAKEPEKRTTPYDDSLKQFGKMLESYNISPIRVQSKIISNDTASKTLPDDISKMLSSAINKIGKQVVYIPYDPNYIKNELSLGGNINRQLPQIVIEGAITEHDKDIVSKNKGAEAEAMAGLADGGAHYDTDASVSRLAMDLHLADYKKQAYFPGVQAINAINITKDKQGWGVAAYYMGCGLSFNSSIQSKQGEYAAIRLLVELSVLELLGKYFDVPYWRCMPGAQPDNDMLERLKDEFSQLPPNNQYAYLKQYLFLHGYGNIRLNSPLTQSDVDLINSARGKYAASNNTELFMKLWESVPLEEARDRVRAEKKRIEEEQLAAEQLARIKAQEAATAQQAQQQKQIEAQRAAAAQQQVQPAPVQPQTVQKQAAPVQQQPVQKEAPKAAPKKNAPTGIGSIKEDEW